MVLPTTTAEKNLTTKKNNKLLRLLRKLIVPLILSTQMIFFRTPHVYERLCLQTFLVIIQGK
jgi:hypothetical protein